MSDVLFLTSADLDGLAAPEEYVEAVRDGFRQRGEGGSASPPVSISMTDPDGGAGDHLARYVTSYMAYLPEDGVAGGFLFSVEDAVAGGDRWYMAVVCDAETAAPLAFLDGAVWMPLKTGAQAAVGTDALARRDARTMGIVGSGRLARGTLLATATVREFDTVRVYSRTPAHRDSFVREMNDRLGATVTSVDSSAAAIGDADVVITATTAPEPVIDGDDLSPGVHVSAMGQSGRERELDLTTVRRADKYVPDLRSRAGPSSLHERPKAAGAFLAAFDAGVVNDNHVYAELGDVVAGRVPGRETDEEITVFDSTGTGIETIASAHLLFRKAQDQGIGTSFTVASMQEALSGGMT